MNADLQYELLKAKVKPPNFGMWIYLIIPRISDMIAIELSINDNGNGNVDGENGLVMVPGIRTVRIIH